MSLRRPKPTQHWHFPMIPCWLLGIQKEHPKLWIKCQPWCCGGTVSISDDVWLAVGPFGRSSTHRHDTESGPHLVTSKGEGRWINDSFRSKWTHHTKKKKKTSQRRQTVRYSVINNIIFLETHNQKVSQEIWDTLITYFYFWLTFKW